MALAVDYKGEYSASNAGGRGLRILAIIPGAVANNESMIFAKRQTDALAALGAEVQRFFLASRTEPFSVFREWRRLRREIAAFKPDVIHCHYGTMTAFIAVCATGLPVVITYRGSDLNPVPSGNRLWVLFSHMLSQISAIRARNIICVSRELAGRLLWSGNKVSVIPTGVDTAQFEPMSKTTARSRLGWGSDDLIVLFNAGRSPEVKRIDLAERALAETRKVNPNIIFKVLAGDIHPDEIPLYHNAADVLLLTSDFEGSPTIVQEAISCGLPVVSVDVGDVKERLATVSPSKIVPRDPEKIGAALLEILAINKRSNGPGIAENEFSNKVVVSKVFEVLQMAAMA